MELTIKYDDITNLLNASTTQISTWNENIEDVKTNLEVFVNMDSFTGMTASSLKSYIAEVNQSVIQSLQDVFMEYQARFLLYREGFFNYVDDDLHTIITEEAMKTCKDSIEQGHNDFLDSLALVDAEVTKINDLVSGMPNASAIKLGYALSSKSITTILQQTEEHEDSHLQSDFSNLESLISSLTSFCNEMLAQTPKQMKTYSPGSIYNYASHQALAADYANSQDSIAELIFAVDEAKKNEQIRQDLLAQEASVQGRLEQGWFSFAVSAMVTVGGVACIIASAGAATPLVAVLAATSGIATTTFGVSNMVQAGHEIYLGSIGDSTTASFNPLRDTVFWGNQTAYDVFGLAATTSSILFTAGISAYGVYQVGGAQATKVFIGKTVATAASGAFGGYAGQEVALYLGASQIQAQWIGLGSAMAFASTTGMGLNALDNRYNWSGTNPTYNQGKPAPEGYKVPKEMQRILDKYDITVEEFNSINSRPYRTSAENAMLKEMRAQVPTLTSDTEMRKIIPIERVDSTIDNPKYSKPGGFTTTNDSVKNITKTGDVIESSRLDYKYGPYKADGDYAYIKYTSDEIGNLNIPHSKDFGGTYSYDAPFAGSGFTAGRNGTIVPEWTGGQVTPNAGSTIHQVVGGTDTVVAEWGYNPLTKANGWVRQ